MQLRRSQARDPGEGMQSEEQLIQRRKPLEAIMANHKISDRIEALLIRNNDVPEDVARQLRTQMTTMFKLRNGGTLVGSPQVTFAQLGVEIAIAQKTGDAGWAETVAAIRDAMVEQEVADTGHSADIVREYLRRGLCVGRLKAASVAETVRNYMDQGSRRFGRPFACLSLMEKAVQVLDTIATTESGELAEAAHQDRMFLSYKLHDIAVEADRVFCFEDEDTGEEVHDDKTILEAMQYFQGELAEAA